MKMVKNWLVGAGIAAVGLGMMIPAGMANAASHTGQVSGSTVHAMAPKSMSDLVEGADEVALHALKGGRVIAISRLGKTTNEWIVTVRKTGATYNVWVNGNTSAAMNVALGKASSSAIR